MSSANFFNGYACDKPTSRVMAPPGGRSSNIFGHDEPNAPIQQRNGGNAATNGNNGGKMTNEAKQQQQQLTPQQQAMQNKQHQQNSGINLFSESAPQQQQNNNQQYSSNNGTSVAETDAQKSQTVGTNGHHVHHNHNEESTPEEVVTSITSSHRGAGIKPKDTSFNDIFGDHPPQYATNGGRAANPNSIDRQRSTVFEDEKATNYKPVNANSVDRQKSTVFEDEKAKCYAQPNRTQNGSNKPRSGYNTITGQTYEDEQVAREASAKVHTQHKADEAAENKARSLHTSSRVLQPPGGRSTGLW